MMALALGFSFASSSWLTVNLAEAAQILSVQLPLSSLLPEDVPKLLFVLGDLFEHIARDIVNF